MQKQLLNTDQLTFTRFLAAVTIVIYHFGDHVFPFASRFINTAVQNAFLGVTYFFMLSGFVMILAYGKSNKKVDFKLYTKNRAARILPLYYCALILTLIYLFVRIVLFKQPTTYQPKVDDFFLNLFLLQSWIPGKALTINAAAWTLSVEAFFYLTFPLIFNHFYLKVKTSTAVIVVVIFFLVSQVCFHVLLNLYPDNQLYFQNLPLLRINEFLVGNALGLIFNQQANIKQRNLLLPIICLFLLSVAALFFQIPGISYNDGLYVIFFIPLVYCVAMDNGPIAILFRKKIPKYLGEISYGIYILQFPVYYFFTAALTVIHHKINQPLFYVYVIVLIVFSAFSYQFVEIPLRDKIKNWRKPVVV